MSLPPDFRTVNAAVCEVLSRHGFPTPSVGELQEVALQKILACLVFLSDMVASDDS